MNFFTSSNINISAPSSNTKISPIFSLFNPNLIMPTTNYIDPYNFDYSSLNNQGWFTDLSLYQDPVIDSGTDYDNQLTLDKMQDNLDFAKEHAQQCMDDGMYVSATMWQNEAHEIQNDMNDVMNNDI